MNVDNVLSGVSDDDVTKHYYRHSRKLLASAGMNLRQWATNSRKLKEKLVAENTIATNKRKFLGLEWDSNADTNSFPQMKVVSETKAHYDQLTKRFEYCCKGVWITWITWAIYSESQNEVARIMKTGG